MHCIRFNWIKNIIHCCSFRLYYNDRIYGSDS